eukprot:3931177-Rhodomonas_salina.1
MSARGVRGHVRLRGPVPGHVRLLLRPDPVARCQLHILCATVTGTVTLASWAGPGPSEIKLANWSGSKLVSLGLGLGGGGPVQLGFGGGLGVGARLHPPRDPRSVP